MIRIDKVTNTKYLGINIDNELKWDVHIENMCQKLSRLIGFLNLVLMKLLFSSTFISYN